MPLPSLHNLQVDQMTSTYSISYCSQGCGVGLWDVGGCGVGACGWVHIIIII
jgi:hypothetical protein